MTSTFEVPPGSLILTIDDLSTEDIATAEAQAFEQYSDDHDLVYLSFEPTRRILVTPKVRPPD